MTPDGSLHDLRRVLALLDGGAMEATYKPALLMALVDLSAVAVGAGKREGPLALPLPDIASRVAELYWQQLAPGALDAFRPGDSFYRLRQGAGEGRGDGQQRSAAERRIPRRVHELRQLARQRDYRSALQVQTAMAGEWQEMVLDVAWSLARQPVPRLQQPPGARERQFERFLYDDREFGEGISKQKAAEAVVTLRPGVAALFSDAAVLLRPAIEAKWTSLVAKFNKLSLLESELHTFLFGAERVALDRVRRGFLDAGVTHCFWCERPVRTRAAVDHVVPWSTYANDALFNLVLAHAECNGDKSNLLVGADPLEKWSHREIPPLEAMQSELNWPVAQERSLGLARAAYAGLPLGVALWTGRKEREVFDALRRQRITELLAAG